MSQIKVDYSKSMIYKLCCKDANITDIYIGSTCNFKMRKYHHKSDCNNENSKNYNYYNYQFIRDNGGFDNFDMILIENVSCNSKRELLKIERDYIDKLKPSLNTTKPYITEDERKIRHRKISKKKYEKYKDKLLEYRKQYYEKNKNQILEKQKEKINCEFCNCLTSKRTIRRHQQSVKCQKFQFIED
tara:strand:+ start:212 stop:772 length:561 start_codon:yes stop_codon:yes gene_type:complete